MSRHANLCHVGRHTTCKCPLCHWNTFVCYSDTWVETYICCALDTVVQNLVDTWLVLVAGPSDLLQHGPRSFKVQLWVRWRIHLLCGWHGRQRARMRPVENVVFEEIETGGGLSADDFQVAVVEGGRTPPRRHFKDWLSSRPLALRPMMNDLLGNQQWRLHPLQNGVTLNQIEHSPPTVVNLLRFLVSDSRTEKGWSPYTSRTVDAYTNVQTSETM